MNNKPIDLITEDTKKSVVLLMNNSGLTLAVINMMLKEIYNSITSQYLVYVNSLRNQYKEQHEQLENEKTSE